MAKKDLFSNMQRQRKESLDSIVSGNKDSEKKDIEPKANQLKEEVSKDIKESVSEKAENKEEDSAEVSKKDDVKKNTKPKESKADKTPGRPKGTPSVHISINIPEEYIDYISMISGLKFNGNKSSYFCSLLEKDFKANKKLYDQIKNL